MNRVAKLLNGKLLLGVLWLSFASLWCQVSTVTAFAARPLLSQTSPAVAILDSANTRNYFGLHYSSCSPSGSYYLGADEYQRYFRGWEYDRSQLHQTSAGDPADGRGRGTVLYFAFSPEYLVSKEFNLPSSLPCPDGQVWTGRSTQLRILMRDAVLLLLSQ